MSIITDLRNWVYIKSTIKREIKNTKSDWYKFNLRSNWYGRTYTVVSLREEDMGEEEIVQNWKAMEKMRAINDYLATLNFTEIVYPSIEKIPNTMSYLIVYSPLLKNVSITKLIYSFSILIGAAIGAYFLLKK